VRSNHGLKCYWAKAIYKWSEHINRWVQCIIVILLFSFLLSCSVSIYFYTVNHNGFSWLTLFCVGCVKVYLASLDKSVHWYSLWWQLAWYFSCLCVMVLRLVENYPVNLMSSLSWVSISETSGSHYRSGLSACSCMCEVLVACCLYSFLQDLNHPWCIHQLLHLQQHLAHGDHECTPKQVFLQIWRIQDQTKEALPVDEVSQFFRDRVTQGHTVTVLCMEHWIFCMADWSTLV